MYSMYTYPPQWGGGGGGGGERDCLNLNPETIGLTLWE